MAIEGRLRPEIATNPRDRKRRGMREDRSIQGSTVNMLSVTSLLLGPDSGRGGSRIYQLCNTENVESSCSRVCLSAAAPSNLTSGPVSNQLTGGYLKYFPCWALCNSLRGFILTAGARQTIDLSENNYHQPDRQDYCIVAYDDDSL
mgnify:CR=1 FL=1